ncbi:PQQ-binding-like beta-propeller repeat protein [Salinilacihabitans rarus]|uniref:outer membrane protein assembly factor BamB family protein n=1 Tax=Salinilacihabitans rarus TaxID=2961596 RepID=UPI0020C86464|nr:PQQ-binding-like beta-propeller repeat protein [Salinilacihabitans rarus]
MTYDTSRRRLLATLGAATVGSAGCLAPVTRTALEGDPAPLEGSRDGTSQTTPDGVAQFRGSLERWGYYPDETVPDAVERAWRLPEVNTGEHTAAKASATPLPDGGVVLPGDTGTVTALSPDGEVRWEAYTDTWGRGVHGTPAVADGRVYVGAYDGALYAFDAETGDRVWRRKLGGSIGASPLYYDGVVFMAVEYPDPDGSMFAVDAETGAVLWEDAESLPTDHPHSTPALDLDAERLVVGANDGVLYGWDTETLELAWTFETSPENGTNGQIKGPIATYDGGAFFGSWDRRVYRVDLEDGTEDWSFETGWLSMTGPAIDPTIPAVFAGSHDGNLYALDPGTGEERWRFGTRGALTGCPTVCADRVVFGSKDRTLYAVEKESGEEVWRVDHEGVVTSTPLVHDGAIYYAERAPNPPTSGEDQDESEIDVDGGGYKLVAAE